MKKLIVAITIIEIVIVIFLVAFLFHKKNATSVSGLNKNALTFGKNAAYRYFYEPSPGTSYQSSSNPDWLLSQPRYSINKDTLNESLDYAVQKDIGVYRIVTLGDSITFGLYLDTEKNYSEILEKLLNLERPCREIKKYEVINLGVSGYDISYVTHRYWERGKKYDPDLAIWLLHNGNFSKNQELIAEKVAKSSDKSSDIADKVRIEIQNEMGEEKVIESHVEKLMRLNSEFPGSLLFVTPKGWLSGRQEDIIQNALKYKNRYFLEMDRDFSKDEIFPDYHPNEKGAARIAEEVYNYIVSENLSGCSVGS